MGLIRWCLGTDWRALAQRAPCALSCYCGAEGPGDGGPRRARCVAYAALYAIRATAWGEQSMCSRFGGRQRAVGVWSETLGGAEVQITWCSVHVCDSREWNYSRGVPSRGVCRSCCHTVYTLRMDRLQFV